MRQNLPVTQREYAVDPDAILMSTTDTSSHITYGNEAFVQASGFSSDELYGQPHNLVRHPDMPAQAFADMWATLKSGQSWTGLVKNRRKDGDHYWVRANAAPVLRSGRCMGYLSVRTQPTREEVVAAEALYRDWRAGKGRGLALHKGLVVRTGVWAWTSVGQLLPVRWRLRLGLAATVLPGLATGAVLGLPAAAAAALIAALAALAWLEAQIARPLQQMQAQAQAVAAGQAGRNVNLDRVDEIGMTLRAINQAGLNLRSLVDDVGRQVGGIGSATTQIAEGNADLAARTEEAVGSLQQTAASIEQMTASVAHNAETALQATAVAQAASRAATEGGEVVALVVRTMDSITDASRRIADITGVIDGIAFQTNILALNAAVEAARAGEQGKGFAVVASEVRSLAQRSADAAREIKSLINASVERVESGTRLTADAGRSIGGIVGQTRRVAELIGDIGAAAREQASGIEQVNQSIGQLDRMTQQNAAMVEQAAAAAASLHHQAGRLAQAVHAFEQGTRGAV